MNNKTILIASRCYRVFKVNNDVGSYLCTFYYLYSHGRGINRSIINGWYHGWYELK